MRKIILAAMAICIGIGIFGQPKNYTIEERIGLDAYINYYEVNVRNEPQGKIIGELSLNDEVTLTGKYTDYRLKTDETALWAEIEFKNGQTAWVTADALRFE